MGVGFELFYAFICGVCDKRVLALFSGVLWLVFACFGGGQQK